MMSSCSTQQPHDIFNQHIKEYETMATLLLDMRENMINTSTCGVNEGRVISFSSISLPKCFSSLDQTATNEILAFMNQGYASHIFIKTDWVKFQISAEGDMLTTNFHYAIYSVNGKAPALPSGRDNVEKFSDYWYILTVVQDTY